MRKSFTKFVGKFWQRPKAERLSSLRRYFAAFLNRITALGNVINVEKDVIFLIQNGRVPNGTYLKQKRLEWAGRRPKPWPWFSLTLKVWSAANLYSDKPSRVISAWICWKYCGEWSTEWGQRLPPTRSFIITIHLAKAASWSTLLPLPPAVSICPWQTFFCSPREGNPQWTPPCDCSRSPCGFEVLLEKRSGKWF